MARNGKLHNKAILKAFVNAIDFHDALTSIGAKAGNNLTEEKTGCITCLESCWIAITSNARYPNISNFKRTFSPNSRFKGNDVILPKIDGYPVLVRYALL